MFMSWQEAVKDVDEIKVFMALDKPGHLAHHQRHRSPDRAGRRPGSANPGQIQPKANAPIRYAIRFGFSSRWADRESGRLTCWSPRPMLL